MTDSEPVSLDLAPPPRRLSQRTRSALNFGHPLALLGALCFTLGTLVVWFLIAGYGLGFTQIRSLARASQILPGVVESSERLRLWTGEPIHKVAARFEVGAESYQALGFRSEEVTLSVGDAVGVVVPSGSPREAWVQGYQKFPIRTDLLLTITAGLVSPGLIILSLGLLLGVRQSLLAQNGLAIPGERLSKWALPRPMVSYDLERWTYLDQMGRARRVWAFGAEMTPANVLLVSSRRIGGAMPINRLLPSYETVEGSIEGVSVSRRRMSLAVCFLFSVQTLMVFLFLWT